MGSTGRPYDGSYCRSVELYISINGLLSTAALNAELHKDSENCKNIKRDNSASHWKCQNVQLVDFIIIIIITIIAGSIIVRPVPGLSSYRRIGLAGVPGSGVQPYVNAGRQVLEVTLDTQEQRVSNTSYLPITL